MNSIFEGAALKIEVLRSIFENLEIFKNRFGRFFLSTEEAGEAPEIGHTADYWGNDWLFSDYFGQILGQNLVRSGSNFGLGSVFVRNPGHFGIWSTSG